MLLTALDSKMDSRTAEARGELAAMGGDLQSEISAVRSEMGGVRTEFGSEINTVKAELDRVKLAVQSGMRHGRKIAKDGCPFSVFTLDIRDGLISRVYVVTNPEKLKRIPLLESFPS